MIRTVEVAGFLYEIPVAPTSDKAKAALDNAEFCEHVDTLCKAAIVELRNGWADAQKAADA